MIHYLGLDVHRKSSRACLRDEAGHICHEETFATTREALTAFAKAHLTPQDQVALEATFPSYAIAGVLRPYVGRVVLSNPLQTKAIAQTKIKTDKVDARVLSQLLRCDYLPEVWQPDAATHRLRRLTHRRATLVAERTRLKNRLHSVLAALGDITRFPDGDHAASYLGLVPSTHQSGEHCYHGPIPRHGNGKARWMLIQAAQHVGEHAGPLGVVATARKLVGIAWQMLRNNEPYRYAQPDPTKTKRARLWVRVSGQKRASGTKQGEARSARYGTGEGVRRLPALPEVLDAEGLPPTQPLKGAEERVLAAMQVTEYVRSLQQPGVRPPRATPARS